MPQSQKPKAFVVVGNKCNKSFISTFVVCILANSFPFYTIFNLALSTLQVSFVIVAISFNQFLFNVFYVAIYYFSI